jgi:group I intron endonuclease
MVYGCVYLITNLYDGKVYVGQTIRSVEERWQAHIAVARKGDDSSMHVVRAIRKYGPDNFTIEVLDTADSADSLNKKERQWISNYDSCNPDIGYNVLEGGTTRTEEDRRRQSINTQRRWKNQKQKVVDSLGFELPEDPWRVWREELAKAGIPA